MPSEKQLLLIANTSWSVYNFRLGFVRALMSQGWKVRILAPQDPYSQEIAKTAPYTRLRFLDRKGLNPIFDALLLLELILLLRKFRPTVVLTYTIKPNIYGGIACNITRTRCIATINGLGTSYNMHPALRFIVFRLYRLGVKKSQFVFFHNHDDLNEFCARGIITSARADVTPGSGVDLDHFSPHCETEKMTSGITRFLLVSRLLWEKGIGEYIEAARAVLNDGRSAEFLLMGPVDEGNPRSVGNTEIDGWTSEGIITYLGYTDDVRTAIAGCDAVVLPSYYREGIPRTLIEAIAMGKPVLTTNSVGCREVVEDSVNGLLFEPRNVNSLVQAMKRFIDGGKQAGERMGSKGRLLAEAKFSESIVIAKYLSQLKW